MSHRRGRLALVLAVFLAACSTNPQPGKNSSRGSGMEPSQLIKSDMDRVAEAHLQDVLASLRVLADKLYKRNPREWKKGTLARPEDAIERLFGKRHNWRFPELEGKFGTDAMQLAFRADYTGDRVFALMAGLGGMAFAAFGERYEFYPLDDLNAQALYNAARNVEIAAWRLANSKDANGGLLLLSNELGPTPNLSFEREFGKVIGNLDTLSRLLADKTNRAVVKVVQSMASAVFLPVAALK